MVQVTGFVAQIRFWSGLPLPLTDSPYGDSSRDAKCGEAIEDDCTNLNLGDLPIEVA